MLGVLTQAGLMARAEEAKKSLAPAVAFADAPHDYWTRPLTDEVTRFVERLNAGTAAMDATGEKAYLLSLLKELDVPASSQLLVYSATSLQGGLIRAANPRALYFHEEVYVGYVPGGKLELASIDPEAGAVFHILTRPNGGQARVERTNRCMNCHAGNPMHRLPGFFTESVIATTTGASLDGFRRDLVGHTVPLADRFGGWHVTGPQAREFPLANLLGAADGANIRRIKNPPGTMFDWGRYPVETSDLLTHLVHEHQLEFHNLVTLAQYRAREAKNGKAGSSTEAAASLNAIARELVRYILFAGEAKLPSGGVVPEGAFANDFLARKKAGSGGQSLRDLELRTRMFKYRCSYMIYTKAFAALAPEVKDRVLAGLRSALSDKGLPEFSYLPQEERRTIRKILNETLPGLPAGF